VPERPRVRKKLRKKKKKEASQLPLILGLIGGGVLLMVVAGGLAWYFVSSPKQAEAVADNKAAKNAETADNRGARDFDAGQRMGRRRGGPGPGSEDAAAGGEPGPGGGESTVATGARGVFDRSCARCHSLGGGGGGGRGGRSRGPNLSTVGRNPSHTVSWFVKLVRDPQSVKPDSRMPAFGANRISDTDLRALAEYLVSLK
jgi:mono/diheme cytochrome c family protein